MPDKPRHRSGYSAEEFDQVKATCLTVAATLGAYLDDLCIVGGLVPALLIDVRGANDEIDQAHPGTNDLDIGLALALLDDGRYSDISTRLRAEGFRPDVNDRGNVTVQRWRLGELRVTVDFLMPPTSSQSTSLRVQNLQPDFGALVTPGLELAFDEIIGVELAGNTLRGEPIVRTVPVCGPGAFVVLKALAFGQRAEPKDAYDLVYVVRHHPDGANGIARRLADHAERHHAVVNRALSWLERDFRPWDAVGPRRAAAFSTVQPAESEELDNQTADAHGYVDDLLRACEKVGLRPDREPVLGV